MLTITNEGRVRTLTLDREDALNAFNTAQYDAVGAALNEARGDNSVACVVITGKGRAFTAGQDLGELANRPKFDDGEEHGFEPFMDALQNFEKPLIAAVNGLGVGIGLTILPHCDLVLMAESARLRAPFVTLGVTAEAGSTVLLPALIGWAETAHLLYTTDWLSAEKAKEIGLVWKVTADDELMAETMTIANEIACKPIPSLITTKRLLLTARNDAVFAARKRETPAFAGLVGAPANREAVAAFMERRDPDFTNLPEE